MSSPLNCGVCVCVCVWGGGGGEEGAEGDFLVLKNFYEEGWHYFHFEGGDSTFKN